jgi:hypothetical protein
VDTEIELASQARGGGNKNLEFQHLENAHVIGQESTYWHVKVHVLMLLWSLRNSQPKEVLGQLLRIAGAAATTAFGLGPKGNTGGTNVSPFKVMPIKPEFQTIINKAKSGR